MLRVFRPTSPMNMGSWLLAAAGSLSALAVFEIPGIKVLRNTSAIGAGILGIPLSGYTGVLLANTAIPVWQAASRTLPVLFIASGMASAGALLHFIELPSREETIARRFAMTGQATELVAMSALEHQVSGVEQVNKPLKQGFSGFLWKTARVLGAASLALAFLPTKSRDFLHGGEEYKFHWARGVRDLTRLELHPPQATAWIYRHAIAVNRAARQMARRVLDRDVRGGNGR
jgi:hypothetical protein